jgi:hypothetical protein
VVAAREDLVDVAREPGGGVLDSRQPFLRPPANRRQLVLALLRAVEPDVGLVAGEQVDGEPRHAVEQLEQVGLTVERDEHQRRIGGERRERADRRAVGTAVCERRHDRDRRGDAAQRLAEVVERDTARGDAGFH